MSQTGRGYPVWREVIVPKARLFEARRTSHLPKLEEPSSKRRRVTVKEEEFKSSFDDTIDETISHCTVKLSGYCEFVVGVSVVGVAVVFGVSCMSKTNVWFLCEVKL